MNVLIQLSHPAQFHSFKNVAKNLMNDGHQVLVVIKSKDILEGLLKEAGLSYVNVNEHAHRGSKLGVLWDMLVREWRIVRLCRKHKIDLLMGSTPEVAHVGWLLRKHRVNIGEDDAYIVPAFEKIAGPFLQCGVTPMSCNNGKMEAKAVKYPGFQKLTYLHPKWFTPDPNVLIKYGMVSLEENNENKLENREGNLSDSKPPKDFHIEPYFLIRFAKLNAHHDGGVSGISTDIARRLVEMLAPHGKIYITSERALEPEFEQYRLHINPLDIHHVMAFATLYIGDSQSMANEAAMLGVPSLRFNDFVEAKKIGVMEEMEKVYGVTYGISSHEPDQLYAKVEELLAMPNLREEFQKRRQKMLSDKIDVTAFLTWFIENYPESAELSRNADDAFWERFR